MYQFIQNTECVTLAKKLDIEFLFCPTLRAEWTEGISPAKQLQISGYFFWQNSNDTGQWLN